jgi:hypothetical protein
MVSLFASGVIDTNAPSRFEAFVKANNIPSGSLLNFDSPGGNLLAGLELGKEIRADGLDTDVAAENGIDKYGLAESKPSLCASACTLAFLGGRFRYVDDKSIYAVHRFYFVGNVVDGSDVAQEVSAAIVQYIRDMGVDPQFFTLMTQAGRSQVLIPTRQQLLSLNIVNNGADKPVWTIASIPQGIYLKGEEQTIWGDNKLLFLCAGRGRLLLTAIFPTRGRENSISEEKADGILLDGDVVRIPQTVRVTKMFNGGNVIAALILSRTLVSKLLSSHTVGFSMQLNYDAGVFDGIADFDFAPGRQEMLGFLASCH